MDFTDTLTIDAPRRTPSGYLAASVRVARTGIQIYSGREVDPDNSHGMRDRQQVRVYRAEGEVFDKASLASLAHKPITVNHPPVAVTADNWRDYAVGSVGDEIARDGEFVRVPIALMDGKAIAAVDAGKNQLSCGYSCELVFGDGLSPSGEQYDAAQTGIRYNHLSAVDVARGGDKLRIGDSDVTLKMITVDGHQVEVTDAAAIAIAGLQAKLTDTETKLTAANTQVGTLTATVSTKDGEITVLKAAAADAVMTPAKLDKLVADRALVATAAKKVFPAVVVDGKTDSEIRKQVVAHKLTDAVAATMNDDGIMGAFNALVASAPQQTVDTFATGFQAIDATNLGDGAKKVHDARSEMIAQMLNPKAAKATA